MHMIGSKGEKGGKNYKERKEKGEWEEVERGRLDLTCNCYTFYEVIFPMTWKL
jgi:hypothetical protein